MKILMKSLIYVILLAVFLTGCAGSPIQLSQMDKNELAFVSDEQLINALQYELYRNELMFKEAKMRQLITDDEIRLIRKKRIKLGMSETALLISWGYPRRINRSVGSYGVHKQYVYGSSSNRTYVYVENGKVKSWQD